MTYFLILLVSIIGSVGTYFFAHQLEQGVVRGSTLVTIIGVVGIQLLQPFLHADLSLQLPIALIGSSFVGMSSKSTLPTYLMVILSGGLFGGMLIIYPALFKGYGGGLGTIACLSVITMIGIQQAINYMTQKKDSFQSP